MNLKDFFNANLDLEGQEKSVARIESGVSFKGANLWILIFAILIASLGLNVNSTAVIIGAMLISPLMGPIIGMGLAVGTNDLELLKRAFQNYLVATLISIITATFYFWLTPYQGLQSELLARTSPTLYDVMIAFVGGSAGILALCIRDKGNVLPGVAIATALMPPLCTAGYGLASGNLAYFAGAFFLYFINTVFIALATFIGTKLMRFHPKESLDAQRAKVVRHTIIAVVVLTMLPAAFMTWRILQESLFQRQVSHLIKEHLTSEGSQIISNSVENDSVLRIVAIGQSLTPQQIAQAEAAMGDYSTLKGYRLRVIQGSMSDSLLALRNMGEGIGGDGFASPKRLTQLTEERNLLQAQLTKYERYEQLSREIRGELKVVAPQVSSISLSRTLQVDMDSTAERRFVTASVTLREPMGEAAREQFRRWLKARSHADSLRIVVTP